MLRPEKENLTKHNPDTITGRSTFPGRLRRKRNIDRVTGTERERQRDGEQEKI